MGCWFQGKEYPQVAHSRRTSRAATLKRLRVLWAEGIGRKFLKSGYDAVVGRPIEAAQIARGIVGETDCEGQN